MSLKQNLYAAKEILLFSLPIIAGQIGQMLFGVGDVIVAGHYSSLAVASIGVAAMIFAPFLMVGIGMLFCTGPLASQLKGQGKSDPTLLFNAYYLSFFTSLILSTILFFPEIFLGYLNLNPEIVPHVSDFLKCTAFSLLPAFIFQATKEYLQANGRVYAPNAIILLFNIVNVLLNILFMFGFGEFKGYGIVGSAMATTICRFGMAICIFIYMRSVTEFEMKKNPETIKKILRLGLPISFTILCEVLVFATVSILVGGMSLIASASQNVVMNITSLTFMVPMALGSAISILIGEQYGKKSIEGVVRFSRGAVTLVILIQICFMLLYLSFPSFVMRIATKDEAVIAYGGMLLFWVGVFQLPDGLQIVLSGIMRGLNQTRVPMVLGLISYWVIGLPCGAYLAYKGHMEARGLWVGLTIGLSCMSVLLIFFYRNRIKILRQTIQS